MTVCWGGRKWGHPRRRAHAERVEEMAQTARV